MIDNNFTQKIKYWLTSLHPPQHIHRLHNPQCKQVLSRNWVSWCGWGQVYHIKWYVAVHHDECLCATAAHYWTELNCCDWLIVPHRNEIHIFVSASVSRCHQLCMHVYINIYDCFQRFIKCSDGKVYWLDSDEKKLFFGSELIIIKRLINLVIQELFGGYENFWWIGIKVEPYSKSWKHWKFWD